MAEIYEQCVVLLEDVAVPRELRADMQEFVDLANETLASRLKWQKRAIDAAIRQKQLKAEFQQRKLQGEIGFD
jgi:hypothetical protein